MLERLDIKAYTKWETVIGKGTVGEPRFGTHTWPELNSALISVVDDEKVQQNDEQKNNRDNTQRFRKVKKIQENLDEQDEEQWEYHNKGRFL